VRGSHRAVDGERRIDMTTKRGKRPSKKVKTLKSKGLPARRARGVRGGALKQEASVTQKGREGVQEVFYEWIK